MTELHSGFDDQVNAFVGRRDAVKVHRVVDGRIPGARCGHLVNYNSCVFINVVERIRAVTVHTERWITVM